MDLRLPATEAPALPAITESERIGDTYAVIGLDARRQVVGLFRPALDRLGAVTELGACASDRPGRVRIGGLVVTRQHPMTAKGTVFLALEDETGMVNVTLWPDTWARLRGVVRRHALLLVDGDLQREGNVVNVIARDGPATPRGGRRGRRPGSAVRRPAARSCRDAAAGLTGLIARPSWSPSTRASGWSAANASLLRGPPVASGRRPASAPGPWPAAAAVRVRQREEPAIPGGGRGEERADERRQDERRGHDHVRPSSTVGRDRDDAGREAEDEIE